MRKLKKIFCFVTIFTLLNNVLPTYASTILGLNNEMYNRVYQEYRDDVQFNLMVQRYGKEYGKKFLEKVLKRNLTYTVRGGGGDLCYQYVTNIMQTKNNNCGTTTVLQTLYGLNSAGAVPGENNKKKIEHLDEKYNVSGQGSLYVYQVVEALGTYSRKGSYYTYRAGRSLSLAQFESCVADSLTSGRPVILHARTKYLSYYGGKKSGHYLSLDLINRSSHMVRIVDCNYDASFYGEHYVPSKEAYKSINSEAGRYIIY